MNEYYATHPAYRARKKVTDRLWRESHPEELKEYQADYYQDNKPYLDKQNQDWFDKNYPHALELQRNRVHKYEQKIKIIILKHYSKGKLTCTECGEKNLEFLSYKFYRRGKTLHIDFSWKDDLGYSHSYNEEWSD